MASIYSIENAELFLEVSSFGAEWKNLKAFNRQRSCLWTGRKEIWPRQAPLLFPVVGKLKDGCYNLANERYFLSPHGFARDSEFSLISRSENAMTFELSSTDESFKSYPFSFSFEVTYSLKGPSLISYYKIKNTGQYQDMPFSIGAHAAFSFDWLNSAQFWDSVVIEFEKSESDFKLLNGAGLLDLNSRAELQLQNRQIALKKDLFAKDALILTPIESRWVEMHIVGGSKIRVNFDEACAFGLWSKKVDEFICLEPWWGLPDTTDHLGNFESKRGLMWLAPGETKIISWSVTFS